MISPEYCFPVYPRFNFAGNTAFSPEIVVCRDLRFFLRPDGYASARYRCVECEMATGRGFETYSFQTRDIAADFLHKEKWEVPEHIIDQMRKHTDDHIQIGAAELAGKTVLDKEEAGHLEFLLKLIPDKKLMGASYAVTALLRRLGAL